MTVEGIDVHQLETFNKEYERSPEGFTLGIEAKTIWEGRGLGNLGRIGRWSLGSQTMEKPTRDFSVQIGSWREVGDAIGVQMADDRVEPVEAALLGLASCVSEAITLNCAAAGANLEGLEVKAHVDVDPGPITGAKDPSTWKESLQKVQVDVTARGEFSDRDRQAIEEGASRSPVHHIFSRTGMLQTNFHYER